MQRCVVDSATTDVSGPVGTGLLVSEADALSIPLIDVGARPRPARKWGVRHVRFRNYMN